MRTRSKLLLVSLTAAVVMAAAAGTSPARTLSISEQRYRAVWTPMTFTGLGGLIQIRCNVTLQGSFHTRTSAKVRGALTGYITSAALTRPCTGGEAWILNGSERATNSLPWHITFDSFRGTLPRITGTRNAVIGGAYVISAIGVSCLYASTAASPAFGIVNLNEATGAANSITIDTGSQIPLRETISGSCPSTGSFAGTTSSLLGAEGMLTVRLI